MPAASKRSLWGTGGPCKLSWARLNFLSRRRGVRDAAQVGYRRVPGVGQLRPVSGRLPRPALTELRAVLDRGDVILGSSASAIIQGSFLVRERPDGALAHATGTLIRTSLAWHRSRRRIPGPPHVFEVIGAIGITIHDNLPHEAVPGITC